LRTEPTDNREEFIKRYIAHIQPVLKITDAQALDLAETGWEMYDGDDDSPEDMADYEIGEWYASM